MYKYVISLGTNCQSRFNISKYIYEKKEKTVDGFYLGENRKNVNDYGTFFFDWSISPIKGIISVFKNDFFELLQLENLSIREEAPGKQSVIDLKSNLIYPHSFPETNEGTLTPEKLIEYYPQVKSKYDYIINKTKNVIFSESSKLLVANGNEPTENIVELAELLNNKLNNHTFLYIQNSDRYYYNPNLQAALKDIPNTIVYDMEYEKYPGNYTSWRNILSKFEFELPCDKVN